ncbi:MAG: glycosyltransferase [Flavobacteriia bacterium]|nr:glycosyltransferase [Flavobacteriia bacterium]OJX36916.1 MAG: hypothetical protein BGO87_14120 [Flavobacteriia bacterium 40-80]
MPRISVITINYNNREGLANTIQSVAAQNYNDYEYIIIDGGSNDGSKEVIDSYADTITYWVSEADKGIYNAMNKGIRKAKGDYVLFLNSGDELDNEHSLSEAVKHIDDTDFIVFDIRLIAPDKTERLKTHPQLLNFYYLFNSNIAHQSLLIKHSLFESIGLYDETLKIMSDWKFNILAMFKHNASYKSVNYSLSRFMLDGVSSLPAYRNIVDKERESILKNEFSQYYDDYIKLNPTYYISAKRSKNIYIRKVQTFFSKIVILLSKY